MGLDDDTFKVSSISYGPYMIYANYMHEEDRHLLKTSFWDVLARCVADEYGCKTNLHHEMA
jgi:hypothetical protein